ncbi:nuclear transport factor 2 family protein [Amycolatopsis mediterranei]|uniref:nuclear transport factor 2 family protein n=1 Tax=Amycolatopsis mediterranei TaxID=33910 RepID=UPI003443C5FE
MVVLALARKTVAAALVAATLTATVTVVPASAATVSTQQAGFRLGYRKTVAVQVLKGVFERGDTAVVDRFVRPDYIQHNPLAPDGTAALKNLGTALHRQFPDAEYGIKRVIAEGDLVLVHSHVVLTPGTPGNAVFDIFRFQDGKIAEHWDTVQNVPATTVNGNDMFSTLSSPRTTQPGPGWLTTRNKELVTAYVDRLLVRKDLSAIDTYVGPEYHQHNPTIADGVAGAKAGLGAYFAQFPQLKVTSKRVIAEGDLVAIHSHYVNAPGDRGQAVVDLFRVRDGRIVEHWDVIQDVPPTSANNNTMF